MQRLAHFLTYNNAVPLTVALVLLGASSTYAFNNPEVFYDEATEIISIDNTYIATINLDSFTPFTEITEVREDDEHYYVTYTVSTIDLVEAVWQDIETVSTLRVRKTRLGPYGDLGVYVTEQLKQVIATELDRLRQTQAYEQRAVTQQTRVTTYSGLIGARLDATTETIPGYRPRVRPPRPVSERMSIAAPGPNSTISRARSPEFIAAAPLLPSPLTSETLSESTVTPDPDSGPQTSIPNQPITTASTSSNASSSFATEESVVQSDAIEFPYLQLLGDANITLLVGDTYSDLGVLAVDAGNTGAIVKRYINETLVPTIVITTNQAAEFRVVYELVRDDSVYDTMQRTITIVSPEAVNNNEATDHSTTSLPTQPLNAPNTDNDNQSFSPLPSDSLPNTPTPLAPSNAAASSS